MYPTDVQCRFEDRLAGRALVLHEARDCITASAPSELDAAFARIEAARARGDWVALLLDYELGAWLDIDAHASTAASLPRLTAWVFARAEHSTPWAAPAQLPTLRSTPGIRYEAYRDVIEALRAAMARGDFYQANYTFPIHVAVRGNLEHAYRAIANAHPSAHAVWFQDARRTILSFSPELFVARTGSTLTVRPMKGTAPRHSDPVQDKRSAEGLRASAKDRAEHLMIVDLLRNDLGRIATPGSVKVETLFQLEGYPSVWTMTSTITAHAPQRSLQDVLRALFPCGSITGAPKIAAMRALRRVEPQPRGIYCGSLGWLAPNGDGSLNVAIRTLECAHDDPAADAVSNVCADTDACAAGRSAEFAWRTGRFGVGGGIVYDSRAEQEWQECLWKARLLNTLTDSA